MGPGHNVSRIKCQSIHSFTAYFIYFQVTEVVVEVINDDTLWTVGGQAARKMGVVK